MIILDKKEEIIEAMYELFAEKGYNTSMSDISKKVGIKPQSIYSHFESKDQIICLTLEREMESKFNILANEIKKASDAKTSEEALKSMFFSIYNYYKEYTKLRFWRNISLINNESLRLMCRDKIRKNEETNVRKLETIFEKGVGNGEIKNINLDGMINLYMAMIQGMLDGVLLYHNSSVNLEDYAMKMWNAYWEGIRVV